MRIIHLTADDDSDSEGSIVFSMNEYVYNIGQMDDDCFWVSRQTIYDYENNLDNFESPEWHPENDKLVKFKFLKK